MFKTIQIIVMAALCLNFSAVGQENKAIDVTTKGIQIGQKVPLINALAKYEGKLMILDFWATWCSPCIAMIPKMEALQTQFKDEVQLLPVTYQTEKEVLPFLKKLQHGKPSILPQINDDKELHKLFPHVYLPHYVWIDQRGTVIAITGHEEVTAENIRKALNISIADLGLKQKIDMKIAYDKTKPFLINGNGGDGTGIIYHSVLTDYTEGLGSKFYINLPKDSRPNKIVLTNTTIPWFFKLAYSAGSTRYFSDKKIIYNVADLSCLINKSSGDTYSQWMARGNGYCYELAANTQSSDIFYQMMQDDLRRFFSQYNAEVKTQNVKCLALVRTSNLDKLKAKDLSARAQRQFDRYSLNLKNSRLSAYIDHLNVKYAEAFPMPLVDLTNYIGMVDLELQSDLTDLRACNKALEKYDLKWIEKDTTLDILVISDAKTNAKN